MILEDNTCRGFIEFTRNEGTRALISVSRILSVIELKEANEGEHRVANITLEPATPDDTSHIVRTKEGYDVIVGRVRVAMGT